MKQVFILHGGYSFASYEAYLEDLKSKQVDYERLKLSKSWQQWLTDEMPESEVLTPRFPNKDNAQFEEWKIYFEKLIPFFGDDVRLVGHSLGAMFLVKYLHDNQLPKKVAQLVLLASAYNDASEDLGSFGITSATNLEKSTNEIHLFHSKDDPIVPFSELAKFEHDIPAATSHVFEDRLHFWDPIFPELLDVLQKNNPRQHEA